MDPSSTPILEVDSPAAIPSAAAAPGRLRRGLSGAIAFSRRSTILSIIDQGLVSGTNFITTLLIGRLVGAGELGLYSLALTIVILATGFQTALISVPYTIFGNRLSVRRQRVTAGSSLIQFGFIATGLSVLVGISTLVAMGVGVGADLTAVLLILTAAMPCLLLREFVRRYAFAHLRVHQALILDASVVALQITGLVVFASLGWLTAMLAYVVIGLATGLPAAVLLWRMWKHFRFRKVRFWPDSMRNWRLGRWVAAGNAVTTAQTFVMHWLLAALLTATATGVYAAVMTLIMLANPILIGIGNVLEAQTSKAWAERGHDGLAEVVWRTHRRIAILQGSFCGLMAIVGGPLLGFLFQGEQFRGQHATIIAMAIAMFLWGMGMAPSHGVRVHERADLGFRVSIAAMLTTLVSGLVLIPMWGTFGGAIAFGVGNLTGMTLYSGIFIWLTQQARTRACLPPDS